MNRRTIILTGVLIIIAAAIWQLGGFGGPHTGSGAADIPVSASMPPTAAQKAARYDRAKEFVAPSGFVNASPFTMQSLIGTHVILVDFWTYSCINCLRTLPYLKAWYAKYHDQGLEIVGVHTPEFAFEHDIANVRAAVQKQGIAYPVVLDNDHGTWDAYRNQYWPHEYLIDVDGFIVHDHIGEGDYDTTEHAIQDALTELQARAGKIGTIASTVTTPPDVIPMDASKIGTPELYLGSARNAGVMGVGIRTGIDGRQNLEIPDEKEHRDNMIYMEGPWDFTPEYTQNASASAMVHLHFTARQVNIVAGSSSGAPVHVRVWVDDKEVAPVTVTGKQLYTVFDGPDYADHDLMLVIEQPGLELFTFTFG